MLIRILSFCENCFIHSQHIFAKQRISFYFPQQFIQQKLSWDYNFVPIYTPSICDILSLKLNR